MIKNYIESIEDALFLMESGDTSFHIGPTQQMDINDLHRADGISDHKEYDLDHGKGGKLTVYKRKGAYEIHHTIKHGDENISGKMVPNVTDVKKFYGTMKTMGTRILNSGNALRIVGNHTNGMFQKYNRMAHIFAKKEGHVVSEPKKYDSDNPIAKDYSEITITKSGKWSPGTMMDKSITDNRTKKSILEYTGGDYLGPLTELDLIMETIFEEQHNKLKENK